MFPIDALVRSLQLEPAGEDRYLGTNVNEEGPGVVFGGQIMAQSIVAALAGNDDKTVKTLHTIFARGGKPDQPLEIAVDRMHAGRAFASSTVTLTQGDRLVARSMVLLTADEPDLIRHQEAAPDLAVPAAPEPGTWAMDIVGGIDLSDPDEVGPAVVDVWSCFPGAPTDPQTGQALLAFSTDGFLIATAMRPHAGVGQAQAHKTLSTGVISHTITFHEPVSAADWLLLHQTSPYAGHGRSYGRADVFDPSGAMVASFVQDAMIRPMPEGRAGGL